MIEELIITMMLGILKSVVKNPARAKELQTALLEVRDTINTLYPGS